MVEAGSPEDYNAALHAPTDPCEAMAWFIANFNIPPAAVDGYLELQHILNTSNVRNAVEVFADNAAKFLSPSNPATHNLFYKDQQKSYYMSAGGVVLVLEEEQITMINSERTRGIQRSIGIEHPSSFTFPPQSIDDMLRNRLSRLHPFQGIMEDPEKVIKTNEIDAVVKELFPNVSKPKTKKKSTQPVTSSMLSAKEVDSEEEDDVQRQKQLAQKQHAVSQGSSSTLLDGNTTSEDEEMEEEGEAEVDNVDTSTPKNVSVDKASAGLAHQPTDAVIAASVMQKAAQSITGSVAGGSESAAVAGGLTSDVGVSHDATVANESATSVDGSTCDANVAGLASNSGQLGSATSPNSTQFGPPNACAPSVAAPGVTTSLAPLNSSKETTLTPLAAKSNTSDLSSQDQPSSERPVANDMNLLEAVLEHEAEQVARSASVTTQWNLEDICGRFLMPGKAFNNRRSIDYFQYLASLSEGVNQTFLQNAMSYQPKDTIEYKDGKNGSPGFLVRTSFDHALDSLFLADRWTNIENLASRGRFWSNFLSYQNFTAWCASQSKNDPKHQGKAMSALYNQAVCVKLFQNPHELPGGKLKSLVLIALNDWDLYKQSGFQSSMGPSLERLKNFLTENRAHGARVDSLLKAYCPLLLALPDTAWTVLMKCTKDNLYNEEGLKQFGAYMTTRLGTPAHLLAKLDSLSIALPATLNVYANECRRSAGLTTPSTRIEAIGTPVTRASTANTSTDQANPFLSTPSQGRNVGLAIGLHQQQQESPVSHQARAGDADTAAPPIQRPETDPGVHAATEDSFDNVLPLSYASDGEQGPEVGRQRSSGSFNDLLDAIECEDLLQFDDAFDPVPPRGIASQGVSVEPSNTPQNTAKGASLGGTDAPLFSFQRNDSSSSIAQDDEECIHDPVRKRGRRVIESDDDVEDAQQSLKKTKNVQQSSDTSEGSPVKQKKTAVPKGKGNKKAANKKGRR